MKQYCIFYRDPANAYRRRLIVSAEQARTIRLQKKKKQMCHLPTIGELWHTEVLAITPGAKPPGTIEYLLRSTGLHNGQWCTLHERVTLKPNAEPVYETLRVIPIVKKHT